MVEHRFPILYKHDKSGKVRYWECYVEGDVYFTRAGLLKTRDNHTWKKHERNSRYDPSHGAHRTAEEVAMEHARSDWETKKRNDAMVESVEELEDPSRRKYLIPLAPVLAQRYDDLLERHENARSKFSFGDDEYYAQYKYDGERMTAAWCQGDNESEPSVHCFSRLRSEIPHLEHIKEVLGKIYRAFSMKNPHILSWQFDGEIVDPAQVRNRMRSIISRVKEKHEENGTLVYRVFDLVTTTDMPFSQRYALLETIMSKVKNAHIQIVPILGRCKLPSEEADDYLARALSDGYEGVIYRHPSFLYPLTNARIDGLIKRKNLLEKDYLLIGAHASDTDAHKDLIIFELQDINLDYVKFSCTPALDHETRKQMWFEYQEDPSKFLGRVATVAYSRLNELSTPTESRVIAIRDPSDMTASVLRHANSSRNSSYEDDE